MADLNKEEEEVEESRQVGGTEYSWCRAVPGGTGTTVLALLLSKPIDITILEKSLHKLQINHPILRSKLTSYEPNTYSFVIPSSPQVQIQSFDSTSTSKLLEKLSANNLSPFHRILEHELNLNVWRESELGSGAGGSESEEDEDELDLFYATLYTIEEKCVLVFRIHTSICDRTSAKTLLNEFLGLIGDNVEELGIEDEVNLGIEDLIPSGKATKPFWARGADLVGYSMNSFRFSNLDFVDTVSRPRSSGVVRMQLTANETERVLAGCQARGIKLSGAIAAAGMIAAYSLKELPDYQWEKYAVVTFVDCRKMLDPPLESHHLGFYYSAVLNTHDVNGGAELWELASKCYMALTNSLDANKHFTDMADLNYLMCKAIDNPSLTSSSSLRTSFIAVFEDPVFNNSSDLHQKLGLEDYIGCSSIHGVGPSIAVFDTIRNGALDCECVYPMPLHSREQVQKLIDEMKRVLIEGSD